MGKTKGFNYQMCILSVISILFVMLGHIKNDFSSAGTFYGWFPYYSFHGPVFFFIAGYFFEDSRDKDFSRQLFSFLWKKTKSFLIPYYVINGIFLLLQTAMASHGFNLGSTFSLREWLLQPWVRPEPYTFSHPSWFLIALFISEVYYILIRKLISMIVKNPLAREIVLTILALLIACASVLLIDTFDLSDTLIVYLRSAYLMFYIQLGALYRRYLEKRDTLPGIIYFPIVFAIQAVIIWASYNDPLYFGYARMEHFGKWGIFSIIVIMNGIALWLRISKLLSMIPLRSRLIVFIGKNTKYLMAFHLSAYFLVNLVFSFVYTNSEYLGYLEDFDPVRFRNEIYYACSLNPRVVMVYLVFGVTISLLIALLAGWCKKGIRVIHSIHTDLHKC